jgi:hypothetical protein
VGAPLGLGGRRTDANAIPWFRSAPRPDFSAFSVVDSGQTIKLGDYEAATDAVLWEFDLDARARMQQRGMPSP